MNQILQEFYALGTPAGMMALFNIILIDIVMSGDNAILIGMATKGLQGKDRKKAIFFGIVLATVLRIVLALFAVYLLAIVGVKFIGGLLLMYVVWKFYRELRTGSGHHDEGGAVAKVTFLSAMITIVVADVSMSLDNVLAVAGAAHGNVVSLGIGLVFSIILMAFASGFIAKYLDKYPQIQWVGLFVILFVAVEMVYSGTREVGDKIGKFDLIPFVLFAFGSLFVYLHTKYLKPIDQVKMSEWITKNGTKILFAFLVVLVIAVFFGGAISGYMLSHVVYLYAFLAVVMGMMLELVLLSLPKKK